MERRQVRIFFKQHISMGGGGGGFIICMNNYVSMESPQKLSKTCMCVCWLLNQAMYENVVCMVWLPLGM